MVNTRITIVTPVFNAIKAERQKAFRKCLESVGALKCEYEHIVVDGASTDGTLDICAECATKGSSIRVISEPDKGLYDALNKGIAASSGRWLYVLGCDDCIVDRVAFEKALAMADSSAADIVASPVLTDGGGLAPQPWGLFYAMPYLHQGVIMKMALVKELGGFNINYKIAGDYDLLLRAHLRGIKVMYCSQHYTLFSNKGLSMIDLKKTFHDNRLVYAEKFGLTSAEADYAEAKRVFPLRVVLRYLRHGDVVVRRAAWHMVKRWVADQCGMMDSNGAMKPNFAFLSPRRK